MVDQEIWTALSMANGSDFRTDPLPWFEPDRDPMDELDAIRLWLVEFIDFIASVSAVDDTEDEPFDTVDDWSLVDTEVLSFLDCCARLDSDMLRGEVPADAELIEFVDLGHAVILRVVLVPLAESHVVPLW